MPRLLLRSAEASRKETANHFERCRGAGMGSEINQ